MISREEVEKLIIEKQIEIGYSFVRQDGQIRYQKPELVVDPKSNDNLATITFRSNFFADRLIVCLGPLALTHDLRYLRNRKTFKNRRGCFDIRERNNKLILEPREVLSVSTIERIKLGNNVGAIIIPRLRNVDSGILYVPSYIDPHWDGILQAVLVNLTDKRQELELGEGLAVCKFYKTIGDIPTEVRDYFPQKSHHYGHNWSKVLDDNAEPFPRRKLPIEIGFLQSVKAQAQAVISFLHNWGLSISILTVLSSGWLLLKTLSNLDTIESSLHANSEKIAILDDSIRNHLHALPMSREFGIEFKKGVAQYDTVITVPIANREIETIWISGDERGNYIETHASLTSDLNRPDLTLLKISVVRNDSSKSGFAKVQWLLSK